jgi:hypothetical protein
MYQADDVSSVIIKAQAEKTAGEKQIVHMGTTPDAGVFSFSRKAVAYAERKKNR